MDYMPLNDATGTDTRLHDYPEDSPGILDFEQTVEISKDKLRPAPNVATP